ncbi:hypothetical protein ABPG72_015545 [Tetrahymena utriculariae]
MASTLHQGYQNLQCEIKGHQQQKIVYICANQDCKRQERLLCTKCAIQHGDSQYFILVDEIVKKDEFKTENWPIDFEGQQIKTFLSQHNPDSFEEAIEQLFTELEEKIAEKIDSIKQDMKLSFKKQTNLMTDQIVKLHMIYSKAYSLDNLKESIFQYIEETIDKFQVENKINEFLHSFQRQTDKVEAKRYLDQLLPKCSFYIDPQRFRDISYSEIISNIDKLQQSFKDSFNPLTWKFVNSNLYQSKALLEINEGITFQSRSEYGEEIILSDKSFQYGSAYMRLRFDKVSENYPCHTLIGLYSTKNNKEEYSPLLCLACSNYSEGMICQNGQKFNLQKGSVIEVIANFDKNTVVMREILNDNYGAIWVSSQLPERLNATPKKFFVFFMNCGSNQVTLLSSY